jgi:hypothetical protein
MESKFKVGQRITVKDKHGDVIEGHVVLILNPFSESRVYYCSMYPGALTEYEYVSVVDLNGCAINDEGKVETLHALNKFSEDELES